MNAELVAFRKWQDALSNADDDLAQDLAVIGRQQGWVTTGGTIVPPGTTPPTPGDELNAAIRRAAGR